MEHQMATRLKNRARDDLLSIPGVGKSIAQDLRDLRIASVAPQRHADVMPTSRRPAAPV
jgi:predicted flap endonuclease-1-like 5' DNA nuclease